MYDLKASGGGMITPDVSVIHRNRYRFVVTGDGGRGKWVWDFLLW
jgi:hypothetical protein